MAKGKSKGKDEKGKAKGKTANPPKGSTKDGKGKGGKDRRPKAVVVIVAKWPIARKTAGG